MYHSLLYDQHRASNALFSSCACMYEEEGKTIVVCGAHRCVTPDSRSAWTDPFLSQDFSAKQSQHRVWPGPFHGDEMGLGDGSCTLACSSI